MTTIDVEFFYDDQAEDVVQVGDVVRIFGAPGTWVVVDNREGWLDLVATVGVIHRLAHESEVV